MSPFGYEEIQILYHSGNIISKQCAFSIFEIFKSKSKLKTHTPLSLQEVISTGSSTSSKINQVVVICEELLKFLDNNEDLRKPICRILQNGIKYAILLGITKENISTNHKTFFPLFDGWLIEKWQYQVIPSIFEKILQPSKIAPSEYMEIKPSKKQFSVAPKVLSYDQDHIYVLLNQPLRPEEDINFSFEKDGRLIKVDRSYIIQKSLMKWKIKVSDLLRQTKGCTNLVVYVNGVLIGTKSVQVKTKKEVFEELVKEFCSPEAFTAQVKEARTDSVDEYLAELYSNAKNEFKPDRNPTLVHLAARLNLGKFSSVLLESQEGAEACLIQNDEYQTPEQIAFCNGNDQLTLFLKHHKQVFARKRKSEGSDEVFQYEDVSNSNLQENYYLCPSCEPKEERDWETYYNYVESLNTKSPKDEIYPNLDEDDYLNPFNSDVKFENEQGSNPIHIPTTTGSYKRRTEMQIEETFSIQAKNYGMSRSADSATPSVFPHLQNIQPHDELANILKQNLGHPQLEQIVQNYLRSEEYKKCCEKKKMMLEKIRSANLKKRDGSIFGKLLHRNRKGSISISSPINDKQQSSRPFSVSSTSSSKSDTISSDFDEYKTINFNKEN